MINGLFFFVYFQCHWFIDPSAEPNYRQILLNKRLIRRGHHVKCETDAYLLIIILLLLVPLTPRLHGLALLAATAPVCPDSPHPNPGRSRIHLDISRVSFLILACRKSLDPRRSWIVSQKSMPLLSRLDNWLAGWSTYMIGQK